MENEGLAIKMVDLLSNKEAFQFDGRVAIIGGGATAVDCAITAKERGATHVELFMLEKLSEMPLTAAERQELVDHDIEVNGRVRISKIRTDGKAHFGNRNEKSSNYLKVNLSSLQMSAISKEPMESERISAQL